MGPFVLVLCAIAGIYTVEAACTKRAVDDIVRVDCNYSDVRFGKRGRFLPSHPSVYPAVGVFSEEMDKQQHAAVTVAQREYTKAVDANTQALHNIAKDGVEETAAKLGTGTDNLSAADCTTGVLSTRAGRFGTEEVSPRGATNLFRTGISPSTRLPLNQPRPTIEKNPALILSKDPLVRGLLQNVRGDCEPALKKRKISHEYSEEQNTPLTPTSSPGSSPVFSSHNGSSHSSVFFPSFFPLFLSDTTKSILPSQMRVAVGPARV